MTFHIVVFLLSVCLLLSLALLWRLRWFPLRPSSSRGRAKRSRLHRLLKPRSPDDCPACRLASPASSAAGPAPAKVATLARGQTPAESTQASQHPGVRLSQPTVPVLREYRCSDPRPRRGWQAWPGRAHPDVPLPGLPYHVQCSTRHSVVSVENLLSPNRHGALRAGRRAGRFRGRTSRRATVRPPSRGGSLGQASTLSSSMSAASTTCTFRTSS